ncbi:hypothetical protein GXP67_09090 [Rhodocytophaga rosea]|uniref:Uncharacterized protein n=1 Tax=Rhodocytophaga rosea TaxID=2704465 RepID=A0A6C0GFJ4_9BACT|nr:hypothetical protein [Rhodocytophaga rosea]QHT66801.1 hypothetical protein GXP67_09090 [Rhodocytophaga rosea]
MLKTFLINVRDYCYIILMTRNGKEYAEKEYEFLVMVILGLYYSTLLALLAVFHFKVGLPIPSFLIESFFGKVLVGLIMFSPYYLIIKLILKKLAPIPINMDIAPEKLKKARLTLFFIFMIGIVLIVLVPWSLDRLLPSF